MRVFIQKLSGRFVNINGFNAHLGFDEMGFECVSFESNELPNLDLARDTPVVGGLGTVRRALALLKCPVPDLDSIPGEIASFAGRNVGVTTMGEVRHRVDSLGEQLFIKPLAHEPKLFNGQVVARFRDLIGTAHLPDEQRVVTSGVVDFRVEYRCYVHQGELVGCRQYKGDFRVFPDFAVIDAAVAAWTGKPVAVAMDFGVTGDGKTLLVEVNDSYSLGSYGLPPRTYAMMLHDRWLEMTEGTT